MIEPIEISIRFEVEDRT